MLQRPLHEAWLHKKNAPLSEVYNGRNPKPPNIPIRMNKHTVKSTLQSATQPTATLLLSGMLNLFGNQMGYTYFPRPITPAPPLVNKHSNPNQRSLSLSTSPISTSTCPLFDITKINFSVISIYQQRGICPVVDKNNIPFVLSSFPSPLSLTL